MSSPEDPEPPRKRQAGAELIIPVMGLAFTAYYASTIVNSPWTAQVNAVLVGSALVVTILALFVRIVREVRRGEADLGFGPLLAPIALLPKRAVFALLTLAYLVLIQWLGFTLSTFGFLALSMILLAGGRHKARSLLAAAGMALIGFAVFIVLFETRFPKGPVEQLYEALANGQAL
jgi:hypothetical protein